MDVIQAIMDRHSVRDFSAKPVPRETVMKIFDAARYSPSGGNGQPWEVFVAAGKTLGRIKKAWLERAQAGPSGPPPSRPPQPAYIMERMAVIRKERMELLGLDPNDPASGTVFTDWGARMFGVPALAVIAMDKELSSHLDMGLFIQTVCLAAKGYGVDTFIAGSLISQPDLLRKELGIPENLNLVTGLGLGYPNPEAVINSYRAPRRALDEVVRYKD